MADRRSAEAPGVRDCLQARRRSSKRELPCSWRLAGGGRARDRLRSAVVPEYTVKALDESTWPAFAGLVERNNGIFGGCWCMGFHEDREARCPPSASGS